MPLNAVECVSSRVLVGTRGGLDSASGASRCGGEMWGDVRSRRSHLGLEMWGDMGRYSASKPRDVGRWGDMGRYSASRGRCRPPLLAPTRAASRRRPSTAAAPAAEGGEAQMRRLSGGPDCSCLLLSAASLLPLCCLSAPLGSSRLLSAPLGSPRPLSAPLGCLVCGGAVKRLALLHRLDRVEAVAA